MLDSLHPRPGRRWARGQKFLLSAAGVVAEAEYREAVHSARALGRAALETAERAWAGPRALESLDGVVLGELRGVRKGIAEIARGLEDCGTTADEVRASIDRLATAGLVEPATAVAAA